MPNVVTGLVHKTMESLLSDNCFLSKISLRVRHTLSRQPYGSPLSPMRSPVTIHLPRKPRKITSYWTSSTFTYNITAQLHTDRHNPHCDSRNNGVHKLSSKKFIIYCNQIKQKFRPKFDQVLATFQNNQLKIYTEASTYIIYLMMTL
jgi:hypothetical protein